MVGTDRPSIMQQAKVAVLSIKVAIVLMGQICPIGALRIAAGRGRYYFSACLGIHILDREARPTMYRSCTDHRLYSGLRG